MCVYCKDVVFKAFFLTDVYIKIFDIHILLEFFNILLKYIDKYHFNVEHIFIRQRMQSFYFETGELYQKIKIELLKV